MLEPGSVPGLCDDKRSKCPGNRVLYAGVFIFSPLLSLNFFLFSRRCDKVISDKMLYMCLGFRLAGKTCVRDSYKKVEKVKRKKVEASKRKAKKVMVEGCGVKSFRVLYYYLAISPLDLFYFDILAFLSDDNLNF